MRQSAWIKSPIVRGGSARLCLGRQGGGGLLSRPGGVCPSAGLAVARSASRPPPIA